jgi:hypothetical protein
MQDLFWKLFHMHGKLICNLYALLCWQKFILVKSGCYRSPPWTSFIRFITHLMLYWASSSTLFVVLTLVDSIAPNWQLGKPSLSFYGPVGRLLRSFTIPFQECKPVTRLVAFLLTSEFMQLKPYSLDEAYLKVGLSGWWALLNCNLALNCADSSRRFSSQNCKIESAFLIRLAKGFHSWPSSEQDGVLLKICNRNEESCVWSLVAITSLNLVVISLLRC